MPHKRNRATRQLYEHNRRLVLASSSSCHWCRQPISTYLPRGDGNKATVDHLTPCSLGGTDELHNLVPACARCNERRGNKPLAVWLRILSASGVAVNFEPHSRQW